MGYARILKDQSGRPSGYRECDGEVCWMPQRQSYEREYRLVKIEPATMEVLNHDFIKDGERVYRQGKLLRGVSPAGFRVINAVYTGGPGGIWSIYGDAGICHPESFVALDDGGVPEGAVFPQSYGRDEEFVYFFTGSTDTGRALRIRACKEPASFQVLCWQYAKDSSHIYYQGAVVKKADAESFAVLGGGYARDKTHLFLGDRLLEDSPEGFVPPAVGT